VLTSGSGEYRKAVMIKTFAHKPLKASWETGRLKIDARLHARVLRRLDVLNAAIA